MAEKEIMVSVSCLAYNHEKYVAQALDSILAQETDFPFEILIQDDASTDGTAEIIRRYEAQYPTIVKPIYQEKNLYGQGLSITRANEIRMQGKYVAYCECDDYWSDPHKLQKQVDFLEAHPEYMGLLQNVTCIDEKGRTINDHIWQTLPDHVYTQDDARHVKLEGQVAARMFRNLFKELPVATMEAYRACKMNGDVKQLVIFGAHGPLYYKAEAPAVHRVVTAGSDSWSSRVRDVNLFYKLFRDHVEIRSWARAYLDFDLAIDELLQEYYVEAWKKYRLDKTMDNRKVVEEIYHDGSIDKGQLRLALAKNLVQRAIVHLGRKRK